MKRIFLLITGLCALCSIAAAQPSLTLPGAGREFWFALNESYYVQEALPQIQVQIAAEQKAHVTVSIPRKNWSRALTIEKDSVALLSLPWDSVMAHGNGLIEDKGVHIISDAPVSVYAINGNPGGDEGSMILPAEALSDSYLSLTFVQAGSRNVSTFESRTSFLIVAAEDNTQIHITPPAAHEQKPYDIILQQGQVYQVFSYPIYANAPKGDLYGWEIVSVNKKKFALFSGGPTGKCAVGYTYDQLLPPKYLGRSYISVPMKSMAPKLDHLRAMATEDGTMLTVSGTRKILLNKGEVYDTASYNPVSFSADKNIAVAQLSDIVKDIPPFDPLNGYNNLGDGALLMLRPLESLSKGRSIFSNYYPYRFRTGVFPLFNYSFLSILVRTEDRGRVTLDGNPIPADSFRVVPGNSGFSYAQIMLYGIAPNLKRGTFVLSCPGPYSAATYSWESCGAISHFIGGGRAEAYVEVDEDTLCQGEEFHFRCIAPENATLIEWEFGDSFTDTGAAVSHRYFNSGWHRVQVSISYKAPDGSIIKEKEIKEIFVYVQVPPAPALSAQDSVFCIRSGTKLSAEEGFALYRWSTGDTAREIRVYAGGTYTLTVTDAQGCSGSSSVSVRAIELRTAIGGLRSVCPNAPAVRYTAEAFDGADYIWEAGGGELIRGQHEREADIVWKRSGTLKLTILDYEHGCSWDTTITVTISDKLEIAIAGRKSFCRGAGTRLSAEGGYARYEWSFDGKIISTDENIVASKPGRYSVRVLTEAGCEGIAVADVTENIADVTIFAEKEKLCAGEKTKIWARGDFLSYRWSTGETTKEIFAGAGTYTLQAIDTNGCSGSSNEIIIEESATELTGEETISFDVIEPDKTDKRKISWTNTGRDTVEITLKKNFSGKEFVVSSDPQLPATLAPGESIELDVQFSPQEEKIFTDKLEFSLSPCGKEKFLSVEGRAESSILHAVVSTIDTTILIGERLLIPLTVQLEEDKSLQRKCSAVVRINAKALYVEGITAGRLTKGAIAADGTQELRVELDELPLSKRKLIATELRALGLISVEKQTAVDIAAAGFDDENIITRMEDGRVRVRDACFNQPVREYTPSSLVLRPSPVTEEAELELVCSQAGLYTAEVYTGEGKLVRQIVISAQHDGEKILQKESIKGYPSGAYFITVTLPDAVLVQKFFVLK